MFHVYCFNIVEIKIEWSDANIIKSGSRLAKVCTVYPLSNCTLKP
jgi:hypothetical protein